MTTITFFDKKIVFSGDVSVKEIPCVTKVRRNIECRNTIRFVGDNEKVFHILTSKEEKGEWVMECMTEDFFNRDGSIKTVSFITFGRVEDDKIIFDETRPKVEIWNINIE